MRVETANVEESRTFDDGEDGCRRPPWLCKCCSNRVALISIIGLVFSLSMLAPIFIPDADGVGSGQYPPFDASRYMLPNSLTFVTLGDWGQHGIDMQRSTANTMVRWTSDLNASFIVSVGDNFYMDGIANVSDLQFEQSWRLVYNAPGSWQPWLAIFGTSDESSRYIMSTSFLSIPL